MAEKRSKGLDVILLLDKSLSMAPFFDQVKAYAAGNVLEPILLPGDRLILETFYGKVERLYDGTIRSEADKAAAIRTLRSVRADGHYTDIGAALDAAQRDLAELGQPDRPKYVLLITDERQEAPAGSPYASKNHKLDHPALEYVKRVDLGKFRAITVGFGVGAKVDAATPQVMSLLTEPPSNEVPGPSAAGGGGPGTNGGTAAAGSVQSVSGTAAGGTTNRPGGETAAGRRAAEEISPLFVWAGLLVLVLALAGISHILLRSRRAKDKGKQET